MASKLKVDELEGVTTAGSIDVTSEGGAVSTNLQQGLAKAWVTFDMDSTNAVLDSFNVSSLSNDATGKNTVNIDNNMDNVNYGITFGFEDDSGNANALKLLDNNVPTTASFRVQGGAFQQNATNTLFDINRAYCVVHGDLA